MLKIGQITVKGKGTRPTSRKNFKAGIRLLANDLGLRLRFESRKEDHVRKEMSYCRLQTGLAVLCESYDGNVYPLWDLMETTLHEIAHWIQFNEGMFKRYFGDFYYGGVRPGSRDTSLALRAERHADWLSKRLLEELYGMKYRGNSIYDDTEAARKFLNSHHRR